MDMTMALVWSYAAAGNTNNYLISYMGFFFMAIPIEFTMEYMVFPIFPMLDVPFIKWDKLVLTGEF